VSSTPPDQPRREPDAEQPADDRNELDRAIPSGDPGNTAASKFRDHVNSKREELDDYEEEEELWKGGYSSKAMLGTWIGLALITILILVGVFFVEFEYRFLVAGILILGMWVIGGLIYAWRRLGVHYQLTSQRFIHQIGIVTRKTDRIEVIDIDDVSFTQGPVERLFGVGTILLTSSDRTHPELSMMGIADVRQVAGLIDDVRRRERRRRSLHIEAI